MEVILLDNKQQCLDTAVSEFRSALLFCKKLNPQKFTNDYIRGCLDIATSIKCVNDSFYSPGIKKNDKITKMSTFAKVKEKSATIGMMQVQSYSFNKIPILWIAELAGCNHGGERLLAYAINMAITNKIEEIRLTPANHNDKLITYYKNIVNSSYLVFPIICNMEDGEIVYKLYKM